MASWESSSRNKSQSRSSRLRMDSYSSRMSSSRKAASSPKRRELDNVMKKARRDGPMQSNYWNKKLLEVEEKDPNRWRHSGFKELYGSTGSPKSSPVRRSRSRSRSRGPRRARTPVSQPRGRSRSRDRDDDRKREKDRAREREREKERNRDRDKRPHTPDIQPRESNQRLSLPRAASGSGSSRSLSSCSDESCSVCSPKANRRKLVSSPTTRAPSKQRQRSRSRSFSVPRNTRVRNRTPTVTKSSARRQRARNGPPSDPRGPPPSPPPAARKAAKAKRREERARQAAEKKRKARLRRAKNSSNSGVLHHSPAPSISESTSSSGSGGGATRLTLSERFGKMAQWSVDRRDLDGVRNMRITKDSDTSNFKVVLDDADRFLGSSPPPSSRRIGLGYYPETLHTSAAIGLDTWDDVRVRYKYYKDRGYLRDLTLSDYMKWEEWWYKYQEWLETERYYERWAAITAAGRRTRKWGGDQNGRRKRRV